MRAHGADEAQPFACEGADQLLLLAAVANRLSSRVDAACQRRIRDNPTAPNGSDEVVFANDPVAVLHQVNQEVEHLGFNGNGLRTAA